MSDVNANETVEKTARRKSRPMLEKVILGVFALVCAVAVGYAASLYFMPKPKVGIISMEAQVGSLFSTVMSREISHALNDPDIKAVVLVINSPGGSAAVGHDVYYQIRRLREAKPVVASMDILAASAAYQIGVGANEIYAKPASIIGNIGVIMGQPSPEQLSERFMTTGPFKATGGSATDYLQKLDLLHADFRDSVVAERSAAPNPLVLSPAEIATGEIWIGIEAHKYGLIDELGSTLDAVERAADMAGLRQYEVVEVRTEYLQSLEGSQAEYQAALDLYAELETNPDQFDVTTQEENWPTFYQLYVPVE